MNINGKIINSENELIDLIKLGINPLEYIASELDIDFICKSIAYAEKSEDTYWDDSAEILLKSIIYYLRAKEDEIKSLQRCKEIIESVINSSDKRKTMIDLLGDNESAKLLYTPIEISSDKNYDFIFETLNTKLSKIA